ncbi:MAG: energy-coupling factor ABC transporter ATP-binding protein [Lachnospiraceae bacterium]
MNIIEIENLTFSYPAAGKPILNNISLQVERGDFLAIVGNNGCGKSTFCKALNGLIPHFISGDFEGKVLVDGLNTLESDVGTLACKAGYVYQDFENQIVRPTVLDDASFACLNYAMPDYRERGKEALTLCGLDGREDDYIWQFPAARPICLLWPAQCLCARIYSFLTSLLHSWIPAMRTEFTACCAHSMKNMERPLL